MSKKDKKQHKANEEGGTDHVEVAAGTSKIKSGKRKRDSELDTSLDTYKENIMQTQSKKRKKEASSSVLENEITDSTNETVESQPARKSKKDKKKKGTTLGVVDVEILQQAEINFHVKDYNADCNGEEHVKKKKKHSKKTKNVSFKEPDEAAELPSKKKKHTKLKDGDLSEEIPEDVSEHTSKKKKHKKDKDVLLEEFTDKTDSEKSTKKRKHTEIEVEITLKEKTKNENEQPTKKKDKNKKAELVSPAELNITNGDGSEQPSKKKKKHKEKKSEETTPEELNKVTGSDSEQPSKKKRKDKEKKVTAIPVKEGEDMNRHDRALQYLRLWKSSRSVWKFSKRMQVYLLHMMYNTSMMADEDFQIMLLYLDGLRGKGREKTMEDARKILDNGETEANPEKEDRARQLYQMLA